MIHLHAQIEQILQLPAQTPENRLLIFVPCLYSLLYNKNTIFIVAFTQRAMPIVAQSNGKN